MKKIFSFYIAVIFVFLSCKDENVLRKSELVSTQACEDYLLIENILLDIDENTGKRRIRYNHFLK